MLPICVNCQNWRLDTPKRFGVCIVTGRGGNSLDEACSSWKALGEPRITIHPRWGSLRDYGHPLNRADWGMEYKPRDNRKPGYFKEGVKE